MTEFKKNLDSGVKDLQNGFRLLMIYHDGVDATGHRVGPDAKEVARRRLVVFYFCYCCCHLHFLHCLTVYQKNFVLSTLLLCSTNNFCFCYYFTICKLCSSKELSLSYIWLLFDICLRFMMK